jgi:hypothetical protein
MPDIDSGADLKYRISEINTQPSGITFKVSVGFYDAVPTWHEQGQKTFVVPAPDVATIMLALPEAGLSRREDMLKVWSQYFIDQGWITGSLVASL